MAQYIRLGPFDATVFLTPPIASAYPASGSALVVKQFQLLRPDGTEIGLDHIHEDRVDSQALLQEIRWRGIVLFSNAARNKKQISKVGFEALSAAVAEKDLRIDWGNGFEVILEADYWRHCFLRAPTRPRLQDPLACDLFMDLLPVMVDHVRSTSQLNQRRFSVATMSPTFLRHSGTTIAQSGIILTLEHIKQLNGRAKKPRTLTIAWYCARYKELFYTTPENDEDGTLASHGRRTNGRDFYSAIASHLHSPTFCSNLVTHKKLLTKSILASFKRDVDTIGTFPPEVRNRWGTWFGTKLSVPQKRETIVIEDTPSPQIIEDSDQERPQQEPMNLGQLLVIDNVTLGQDVGGDEWVVPMAWEPTVGEGTTPSSVSISETDTSWVMTPLEVPPPSSIFKAKPLDAGPLRLASMIPKCMFDPPNLPVDCQWVCPVAGCAALFDLKGKLPRKMLMHLTPKEIKLLSSRAFNSSSQEALTIFFIVVDVHYDEHLSKLGIVADKEKMFREIRST